MFKLCYFSDCDCDSSYHNKWVVQDSMEMFTLCDCNNVTNSYLVHYKQKQIAVAIKKNAQCEWAIKDFYEIQLEERSYTGDSMRHPGRFWKRTTFLPSSQCYFKSKNLGTLLPLPHLGARQFMYPFYIPGHHHCIIIYQSCIIFTICVGILNGLKIPLNLSRITAHQKNYSYVPFWNNSYGNPCFIWGNTFKCVQNFWTNKSFKRSKTSKTSTQQRETYITMCSYYI